MKRGIFPKLSRRIKKVLIILRKILYLSKMYIDYTVIQQIRRIVLTTQNSIKLRPLMDKILVQRKKTEEQNIGGIILPDSAQSKQDIGTVLACGPGKKDKDGKLIEMPVKAGDQIMWDKYGGQEVTIEEQEYIIVKADDVIAVVE